jgi:hypothetical protein
MFFIFESPNIYDILVVFSKSQSVASISSMLHQNQFIMLLKLLGSFHHLADNFFNEVLPKG